MKISLKESVGISIAKGKTDTKIAALARAGRLGIILWHMRYAGENRAVEAENLLLRRSAKRLRLRHVGEGKMEYRLLRLACRQALIEWMNPNCEVCHGVAEVSEIHKRVVCNKCEGTGVRNWSDWERCDALKITKIHYEKTWDKRFKVIHGVITGKDAETGAKVREQLMTDEALLEIEPEAV